MTDELELPASLSKEDSLGQPTNPETLLPSAKLFGEGSEVLIEHDGVIYRLRITRRNRLILTK